MACMISIFNQPVVSKWIQKNNPIPVHNLIPTSTKTVINWGKQHSGSNDGSADVFPSTAENHKILYLAIDSNIDLH